MKRTKLVGLLCRNLGDAASEAEVLDLGKQTAHDSVSFHPAARQVALVIGRRARGRCHRVALRQNLKTDPLVDAPATEAKFLRNYRDRPAGIIQTPNLLELGLEQATQSCSRVIDLGGYRDCGAKWAPETPKLLLDDFTRIQDQMEAISDLSGVRTADPSSLGVKPLTIAADNLEGGCALRPAATLVDDRSARTSTTHRRSRSTMMVP